MNEFMNFTTATDRATRANIRMADIAAACGVSANTVNRARMDPESPDARPAPSGWRTCLAKLCRERAALLSKLADQLDRG